MSALAFWPAPHPEINGTAITLFAVERAASQAGTYASIAVIPSQDQYGNWITHYLDTGGTAGTHWYRVTYLEGSASKGQSVATVGATAYEITPQDIVDTMQGLPLNFVDARLMQTWIEWAIEAFEAETGMLLTPTSVTKEIHDYRVFQKILGAKQGARIYLRRRPIISVSNVYYRVRAALLPVQDVEWQNLDVQIEYNGHPDGYNPGCITIFPRVTNPLYFQGTTIYEARTHAVNVLFSYSHGFAAWPRQVKELILRYSSADIMEIAGQAESAGLSSRSIDGYSESMTASATTTTLSAMRMYYKEEITRLSAKWKKPILAA